VGEPGASPLVIRAQLAEVWDMVRVEADAAASVLSVKERALDALDPGAGAPDEYAVTLKGAEILDESVSLSGAGVINGSTLLIERRRRRPVR